jgi:dolichol-phosphate mannosyltransferase
MSLLRGHGRRAGAFAVVGATGVLPNVGLTWLLAHVGVHHLLAGALATQAAVAWNFALIERVVFRDRRDGTSRVRRAAGYAVVGNADLPFRLLLLAALVPVGVPVALATAITIAAAFVLRYLATDRLVYRPRPMKEAVDVA